MTRRKETKKTRDLQTTLVYKYNHDTGKYYVDSIYKYECLSRNETAYTVLNESVTAPEIIIVISFLHCFQDATFTYIELCSFENVPQLVQK